jgi:hypothetical protein
LNAGSAQTSNVIGSSYSCPLVNQVVRKRTLQLVWLACVMEMGRTLELSVSGQPSPARDMYFPEAQDEILRNCSIGC